MEATTTPRITDIDLTHLQHVIVSVTRHAHRIGNVPEHAPAPGGCICVWDMHEEAPLALIPFGSNMTGDVEHAIGASVDHIRSFLDAEPDAEVFVARTYSGVIRSDGLIFSVVGLGPETNRAVALVVAQEMCDMSPAAIEKALEGTDRQLFDALTAELNDPK
jgi:hypothetical protein